MTQRIYDENGWLFIPKNPISKAGVFPYLGAEIGAEDPCKVYQVLRSPEELIRTAETFKLLPIIDEHELLGSLGTSTDARPAAGTTGEAVEFENPYLYASLKITSDKLQREIAGGKIELSPAYTCDWIKEDGIFDGARYDYKQIIKHGNHLALVEKGRTGPDVAVLDHYAFDAAISRKGEKMNLEEFLASYEELSDEDKVALLEALGVVKKEEEPEQEDEENIEPEKKTEDEDVLPDEEEQNKIAKESTEDGDAVEVDEELIEKISQDAMARAVKHIDARNRMAEKVKPFVGSTPASAMDSAETVAAYTLKKFGIKHQKGQATAVISGFLHGRKPAGEKVVAQDSGIKKAGKVDISKFGWEK